MAVAAVGRAYRPWASRTIVPRRTALSNSLRDDASTSTCRRATPPSRNRISSIMESDPANLGAIVAAVIHSPHSEEPDRPTTRWLRRRSAGTGPNLLLDLRFGLEAGV